MSCKLVPTCIFLLNFCPSGGPINAGHNTCVSHSNGTIFDIIEIRCLSIKNVLALELVKKAVKLWIHTRQTHAEEISEKAANDRLYRIALSYIRKSIAFRHQLVSRLDYYRRANISLYNYQEF